MLIPFAPEQEQLLLGKVGIEQSQWDAVKCQVPGGKPGIFPFIGHGDDIGRVQMAPFAIASLLAFLRRRGLGRIAVQPLLQVVMVELF